MGMISDYFAVKRLRPVLNQLPYLLAKRYGAANFYTAAQLRATVTVMKLNPKIVPAAFAIGCAVSEFTKADPNYTQERYRSERKEIARLSGIGERNLNCAFLTDPRFHKMSPAETGFSTGYPSDGGNNTGSPSDGGN